MDKEQTSGLDASEKLKRKELEGDENIINELWASCPDEKGYEINIIPREYNWGEMDLWQGKTTLKCPPLKELLELKVRSGGLAPSWCVLDNVTAILVQNQKLRVLELDFQHEKGYDNLIVNDIHYDYMIGIEFVLYGDSLIDGNMVLRESDEFLQAIATLPDIKSFKLVSRFSNWSFDWIKKLLETLATVKTLSHLHICLSRNSYFENAWRNKTLEAKDLFTLFKDKFSNLTYSHFNIGAELGSM